MIFPILTLLSAFSLAAVAAWFSIIGIMTIYASAPVYAITMGIVSECSKLVTASWLYRNWPHAGWTLKAPLLAFLAALMMITSIGVFGFLSKAHLDQTAGTLDTAPRVEQLTEQISKEQEIIADNNKVIAQLDQTVDALTQSQRIRGRDGSIAVRQAQSAQRQQLRDDSTQARQRIDQLNSEKFALESQIRKLELEVGPIRYIAELIYGVEDDATKNIAAAVQIFTLLITLTLDPLAVTLLIAANYTLLRIRNEKEKTGKDTGRQGHVRALEESTQAAPASADGEQEANDKHDTSHSASAAGHSVHMAHGAQISFPEITNLSETIDENQEKSMDRGRDHIRVHDTQAGIFPPGQPPELGESNTMAGFLAKGAATAPPQDITEDSDSQVQKKIYQEEIIDDAVLHKFFSPAPAEPVPGSLAPAPTPVLPVRDVRQPWANEESVLRSLIGSDSHFVPTKVIAPAAAPAPAVTKNTNPTAVDDKYPKALSWLTEFKGK